MFCSSIVSSFSKILILSEYMDEHWCIMETFEMDIAILMFLKCAV